MTTKPTHHQLATALYRLREAAIARASYPQHDCPPAVLADWRAASATAHELGLATGDDARPLPLPGDYETEVLAQFVAWLQAKMDEPRGRMAVLDLLDNDTVLAEYDTHLRPEN